MASTKDIDVLKRPKKILLVSPNGLGKSIVAGSFHVEGKIVFEDLDLRMDPVKEYYPDADIRYNSWTSENFNRFVERIHAIIRGEIKPDWKTWVLDSVTSTSITSVTYQLKVKGTIKTTGGGLPATSWDEINGETVFMHEIIEAFQVAYAKFGCNVIFTSHPIPKTQIIEGESTKHIMSLAAYGNKIPSIVPGYFNEIYSIGMDQVSPGVYKRFLYTLPHDGMPGKTALFRYLPDKIDITNKNFCEILNKILAEGPKK